MSPTDDEVRAARQVLERDRLLFAEGPVVVFRWVNAPGWPVESVSTNVEQVFGHPADAFVEGRVAYADTIHPEDLERVTTEVTAHGQSGVAHFEQEYRIVHREGGVRWLRDHTQAIRDATGNLTHFQGYVLDATEWRATATTLREREQQLADTRRIESLGRLAGGVAHDFNNLLTAIGGHLDLLAVYLTADHPGRASLATARRTVHRGAALTSQLLAVSRRQHLAPRAVEVNRAIRETLDLLSPLLGDHVRVALALGTRPAVARVDPTQLQQVLMNLTLNARDAMPNGGTLQIATRSDRQFVTITVSDTGVGMESAVAARIFEPFYSTREGGTGLGLATVQGIVEQSHGSLRVQSTPGQGTSIEVDLPATIADPTPSNPPPPVRARSARILLVEDHADIRELMIDVLTGEGHEVVGASNVGAALEATTRFALELLITDVSMPGGGGVELLASLDASGWRGPVLFVSGHVRELQLPLGPKRQLLRKPFGVDRLLRHVSALLEP